jgi:hypothetical protein
MGFGIDSKGEPFYLVDQSPISYSDIETTQLPNGKTVKRAVTKEYKPEPLRKTPSEMGWEKVVKFEDVLLIPIANQKNYGKIEKQLFHRVYEVSISEYYKYHTCNICEANSLGSKHHYFRSMPSGIFTICWVMATKFGRSASGPIQTLADREGNASPWVKLVSEKKIGKKDAKQILQRLQRVPNLDVAMYLNDFEVV